MGLDLFVWGVDGSSGVKIWTVAEESFVWGHPQRGIRAVVVDRRSDGEPFVPVVLLGRSQETEVLFDPLVLPFGQAVRLRVKCRRQVLGDAKLRGQCSSKVRREPRVSV